MDTRETKNQRQERSIAVFCRPAEMEVGRQLKLWSGSLVRGVDLFLLRRSRRTNWGERIRDQRARITNRKGGKKPIDLWTEPVEEEYDRAPTKNMESNPLT